MARCLIVLSAACGVGKSTLKNAISESGLLPDFVCADVDEVGINWWDYAGKPHQSRYTADCLEKALEFSEGKHLLFTACLTPFDFLDTVTLPDSVTLAGYIGMTCADAEVRRRLLARPPERRSGEESFILSQIEYNGWIRGHGELYGLHFDNTNMTVEEAARKVADYARATVSALPDHQ